MKNCAGKTIAQKSVNHPTYGSLEVSVLDCENCGYAHIQPIPEPQMLDKYYAFHFYDKEKPHYLTKMEAETDYWMAWYSWRLALVESHLPTSKQPRKILDVGSSGGFLLEAAHRRGWKVQGVEPSTQAANYCRTRFGHEVQETGFEDAKIEPKSLDAVHCSLVLEHLREPEAFMQWARTVLKPEGVLVIEIPNEFNRFQNILTGHLGKAPWFVSFPDHINYFTPASLRRLAEKQSYKVADIVSTFPIETFVLMGDDYIGNDPVGRECHKRRMNFEMNLLNSGNGELLTQMYRDFAKNGIGREIIAVLKP